MYEGKRPGGLTALAVLNFVFAGLNGLNVLGSIILVLLIMAVPEADEDTATEADPCGAEATESEEPQGKDDSEPANAQEAVAEAWAKIGIGVVIGIIVLYILLATLQIVSGIGYLKQKAVMGRTIGNVYALFSIGTTAFEISITPEIPGVESFSLIAIIAIIYPVLTLILLNTTFKEDFVR